LGWFPGSPFIEGPFGFISVFSVFEIIYYVFRKHGRKVGPATGIGSPRKGTKKAELMAGFFLIDMHQNLEKPPESLGIEMEPDDNDTSDFQQRYMVCSEIVWFLNAT
jgi:hypothetical protein